MLLDPSDEARVKLKHHWEVIVVRRAGEANGLQKAIERRLRALKRPACPPLFHRAHGADPRVAAGLTVVHQPQGG